MIAKRARKILTALKGKGIYTMIYPNCLKCRYSTIFRLADLGLHIISCWNRIRNSHSSAYPDPVPYPITILHFNIKSLFEHVHKICNPKKFKRFSHFFAECGILDFEIHSKMLDSDPPNSDSRYLFPIIDGKQDCGSV